MSTVTIVIGTRPEAIKLAPVIAAADAHPHLHPIVVATGQHAEMAADALAATGHDADIVLALPKDRPPDQPSLLAEMLPRLGSTIAETRSAAAVVQGDTASALAGALAAFARRVPVVHVEAGLRSDDLDSPFPEEGYRRMITAVASVHLPPTPAAQRNLEAEGVPASRITCTGNTVVDAVAQSRAAERPPERAGLLAFRSRPGRRLAILTVHRRESWGAPLDRILHGIQRLVRLRPDLDVVVPVHPNPLVSSAVRSALGDLVQVHLLEPLSHRDMLWLLAQADVVLSDSGGIQEEAPSFGVHVVVLRDATERTEAVDAGCATLAGADPDRIVAGCLAALDRGCQPSRGMGGTPAFNPFGDGRAAERVVLAIDRFLAGRPLPRGWSGQPATTGAPRWLPPPTSMATSSG
ncbi:MAG: non-hydrolyzing UDP-N-acetylglucosamine 2-epimerase [Aquihabitans sp.]